MRLVAFSQAAGGDFDGYAAPLPSSWSSSANGVRTKVQIAYMVARFMRIS
jgi:hypothetical protein